MTAPACVRATVGNDVVTAHWTDCLPFLRTLPDNSLHAIITDPPYGLANHSADTVAKTMVAWAAGDRERVPDGRGFMGRSWDTFVPPPAVWDEAMRVLKPGGHIAVFCGSRMVGPLDMSIRLAGFEMRDSIAAWLYGSGFPKSLDVGKALDKVAGATREVVGQHAAPARSLGNGTTMDGGAAHATVDLTAPTTDAARAWSGWGTALKPAHEPILIARKPLAGTVAANTLAHGCGGLNVDACRVGDGDDRTSGGATGKRVDAAEGYMGGWADADGGRERPTGGRWPTNVVLAHAPELDPVTGEVIGDACADGCVPGCHVAALDEQSGVTTSIGGSRGASAQRSSMEGGVLGAQADVRPGFGDTGGASRFYPTFRYTAKAGKRERPQAWGAHPDCACEPSRPFDPETGALPPRHRLAWRDEAGKPRGTVCASCGREATFRGHPTVKPGGLIGWLVDLLVPSGGTVADLFSGSGSLGGVVAARGDGTRALLCERDEHSVRLIATRLGVPHDFRSAPLLTEASVAEPDVHVITTVAEPESELEPEPEPEPMDVDPLEAPPSPRRRHPRTPRPEPAPIEQAPAPAPVLPPVVDDTPAGRIAAAVTTAELTRVHAELRAEPAREVGDEVLWDMVSARWDEISAAARPTARRARTQRPRKPTWAS